MPPRSLKKPELKPAGEYHHGNLRRALIDASIQLLESAGGEAFTLRAAARLVGVDHRAAYRHFEDRDALLAAIAEESYRDLTRLTELELALQPAHDPSARLLAIARAYVRYGTQAKGRYATMTGPRVNEQKRFPELERAIHEAMAQVERELRAAARPQLAITEAALALLAAVHGLTSLILVRRIHVRRAQLDAFTERAIGHTVRGILHS